MSAPPGWVTVCALADLSLERGVAVLVGGRQMALFRIPVAAGDGEELLAISNHDPFSDANILSRGIVGSAGDRTYVASPMFKQRFDLRSGECLDADGVAVEHWPARAVEGWVYVLV